jgi:hypothetical protein
MWYLDRLVGAYEWGALADICDPQRDYDGGGIYAFCKDVPDSVMLAALNRAASGDWMRVA